MQLIKIVAVSAIAFGAPVLTDSIGLTDIASAYAKGNGNGGGNGGGGNGGGNGGGKSDGNGGGKSNGNGGGKSNGNGKGNSGDKGSSNNGKSASKGHGGGKGNSASRGSGKSLGEILGLKPKSNRQNNSAGKQAGKPAKAKSRPATGPTVKVSVRPPKQRPVQAQLKGLNSLNRNINGLMNSNDPKMDGFRDYVEASAMLAEDQEALADAIETFGPTLDAYGSLLEGLGYDVPTNQTELEALSDLLNEQASASEPSIDDFTDQEAYDEALAAWNEDMTIGDEPVIENFIDQESYDMAVTDWSKDKVSAETALAGYDEASDAYEAVDEAQVAVEEGLLATSDDVLTQAIVDGWNATGAGPTTEEDVTPEVFDWVSDKLGVGENQDGLIDDYIAQQPQGSEIDPSTPGMDEASVEDLIEDEINAGEIVEES